ncbi:MAG TPA: hypothetical protein VL069_07525 [Opitutus sp.]|nr:hypothetical protein [Opitutus sp.]
MNGKRLVAGQRGELNVAGIPVGVECVSVDAKSVTLRLPPEPGHIILKTGSAPILVP